MDESFFYDWIRKKAKEARALDSRLASVLVDDMGLDTMRIYISTTGTWWNADSIKKNNNIDKLIKFFNDTVKECKREFPNVKIITE